MDGPDLNDVSTFVRVAEGGGGFTAAARGLGVPKSTVSRAVARLEKALGVRLVQRTTRSLALTDAGRVYYERVREAVAGVAQATSEIADMGKEPRGTVRITAPADVGQALLAEVIALFVQKYPQVHFEVSLTSRVVDLVAERFDLAIRASPLDDSSLVARKLGAADLGIFASPAYLKKHGTPSTVAELASHEFIGFRPLRAAASVVLSGPSGQEKVDLRGPGAVLADDLLFVQRMVAAGAGLGLLPLFFSGCASAAERQGMRRVLPDWAVRGPGLSVVAPSARHEPRSVRLFRDFLVAEARRRGFGR